VWLGADCDAALLKTGRADAGDPVARLGKLASTDRAPCRAVGFPLAQATERGQLRDAEDLAGEIAPISGLKRGILTVSIVGSVPKEATGRSSWEGMSGAALFSGPSWSAWWSWPQPSTAPTGSRPCRPPRWRRSPASGPHSPATRKRRYS
jgi:hypothetical protein